MTAMAGETAGAMRERGGLLTRSLTPDGAGGAGESWTPAGEAWAAVRAVTPGPAVEAEQAAGRARWRVTLRERDGLARDMRLTWRGRTHAVLTLTRDPAMLGLVELMVEEMA